MSSGWFVAAVALYGVLLSAARREAGGAGLPRLLVASAAVLGLVGTVNFVVNPFGIYAPRLFEPMVLYSRAQKLKLLDAAAPPEAVILGSSATFSMAPEQIRRRTGLRAFNASVHGASPRDYHALMEHLAERETWPKLVVVALSFEQLRPGARVGFEPGDPLARYVSERHRASFSGAAASLLAADQTQASFRRLQASAEGNVPPATYHFAADGFGTFTNPPDLVLRVRRDDYPELRFAGLDPGQWGHLQAVLEACRAHGTRVIVFFPPLHPELARLWEETTSLRPVVAELQRRLASYAPDPVLAVHDFRRLESYGGRPELFLDMRHPDTESNRLMLDVMLRDLAPAAAGAR
ncbi:MAG: hypothetical protein ABW221_21845 [Vicinamibacteria bacterium]